MIQDKVQSIVKSGGVNYGKESFSFYILHGLDIRQNFEMGICLLSGEWALVGSGGGY